MHWCHLLTNILVLGALLVPPASCWIHGKPEQGKDDAERSQSASEMLRRLWGAARERSAEAQRQRVHAESQGETYTPTNAELFAGFMDYAKDKLENPPLLQVEKNLLAIQAHIKHLAKEVKELKKTCTSEQVIVDEEPYADREWRESMNALHNIMNASLHAVQGKRYTIIKV